MYSSDHQFKYDTTRMFNNLSEGIYEIYVVDKNGCITTWSIPLKLINYIPFASAGKSLNANAGQKVILDGAGSYDPNGNNLSFKWYSPEGITLESDSSVQPSFIAPEVEEITEYKFILVVNDGLVDSRPSEVTITVYPLLTKISPIESTHFNYSISPNPNTGQFVFQVNSQPLSNFILRIYNPIGKVIETRIVSGPSINMTERFYLNNHVKGMYFLQISTGSYQAVEKIIVN